MSYKIEQIEGKYLNNLNKIEHIPISKIEEYNLFKLYKTTNDIKYRNIIWNSNLKFVVSIANKYTGEIPKADLISEGNLGLLHAIDLFDYESNIRFITYARRWIIKYITEYLKKYKKSITAPVAKTFEQLNISFVSLDGISLIDSNLKNIDTINDTNSINPDQLFENININKLLNCLSSIEILYLEHYYGLNGKEKLTIVEISNLYGNGKTKQRIQQILEKSKVTLKNYLSNRKLTDVLYE